MHGYQIRNSGKLVTHEPSVLANDETRVLRSDNLLFVCLFFLTGVLPKRGELFALADGSTPILTLFKWICQPLKINK